MGLELEGGRAASLSASFAFGGGEIPDGTGAALEIPVVVSGLASVSEDVLLHLDFVHAAPAELTVSLVDPDGTEVAVRTHQGGRTGGIDRHYVALGFPGDESVNGTWTLRVVDPTAGNAGRVVGGTLGLTSRWD